jgi:hypothetical protein
MELINHISCLPLEILEREIIPWLSPPEAASLILAVGRSMFGAARPVIWIRWKHILEYGKPELTLTLNSRGGAAWRIINDLRGDVVARCPADPMYKYVIGASETQPGWCVRGYVVVKSMITHDPSIAERIDWHTLGSNVADHGELMMGKLPSSYDYARSLVRGKCRHPEDVQDDLLIEYLLSCRDLDMVKLKNYISRYFGRCPPTKTRTIELLLAGKVYSDINCKHVPIRVYRMAVATGYLWATRDILELRGLSQLRWDILAMDFISRVEATGIYVEWPRFDMRLQHIHVRVRDLVAIMGPSAVHRVVSGRCDAGVRGIHAAIQFRKIVGDIQLLELTIIYRQTSKSFHDSLHLWIISGCGYAPVASLCSDDALYNYALSAIRCENVHFFRDMLTARRHSLSAQCVSQIVRECIAVGSLECFTVTLDLGMTTTPAHLRSATFRCRSLPLLGLLELMG